MPTTSHTLLNPGHRRFSALLVLLLPATAVMARRKSNKPPEDDSIPEKPVQKSGRKINSGAYSLYLAFITLTVGGFMVAWFCVQQQHSLDRLSESFTTAEQRVTNLQQVVQMTREQPDTALLVEERFLTLQEVHKQAQEKAEFALATSEKLKNSDLLFQLRALQAEMDTRLDEIKQVPQSVTALRSMFKNQSEEFEVMKESIVASLSSSLALSETVAVQTSALASVHLRVAQHITSVEALNAQLEVKASELNELKDSLYVHNVAVHSHNQEIIALKKLVKAKQAMRVQALQEMFSSVLLTLDEQFFTSEILHSSVIAQLQTVHTQLSNRPRWPIKHKSKDEDCAHERPEPHLEHVKEKTKQVVDPEREDQEEEGAIQEEQPQEMEVDGII
ncbi:uncharacterized protein PAE49_003156 [Odontesthes bonariensis]|uniref:uncharacterized protein LOC142377898 n=1 Tax=Odontesthes bonariensis TaxID=219752 RepID=UPI003F586B3A